MNKLEKEELYDIANGATLLASGGGGSKTMPELLIPEILTLTDNVVIKSINEVEGDEWGAVVGAMGSPIAFEKVGLKKAALRATERLESAKGMKLSYTIAVETGSNIFVAMLAGVQKNRKLFIVDGDGVGRAVPTLECLSYAYDVPVSPFTLANASNKDMGEDNPIDITVNIETKELVEGPLQIEQLVRPIISTHKEFDGVAGIAGWMMNGKDLSDKKPLIEGTISFAQKIGKTIREGAGDPILALRELFGDSMYLLLPGNGIGELVNDPQAAETTSGGFDHGDMIFKKGDTLIHIINQNENLIAWDTGKGRPVAMAPDLICYLRPDGTALSNPDLKQYDNVYLIGIKANPRLRESPLKEAFLNVLKGVGYYGAYIPIEDLHKE